jgi:hypothetical protein
VDLVSYLPERWAQLIMFVIAAGVGGVLLYRAFEKGRNQARGIDRWLLVLIGILFVLVALTSRSRVEEPSPRAVEQDPSLVEQRQWPQRWRRE